MITFPYPYTKEATYVASYEYSPSLNKPSKEMNYTKITDPKSLQSAVGTFVIASVGPEGCSIASNPVIHNTADSARMECARLSKLNANKAFTYLRICGGELVEAKPTKVTF